MKNAELMKGASDMKRLLSSLLAVSFMFLFAGCGGVSDGDFNTYDILSFHLDEDTREVDDTLEDFVTYKETWTITNNNDRAISGIAFTVSFLDENDTIIKSDSRTLSVSLAPGQSYNQLVYSTDEYESSMVTSYEYELENGRIIGLDLVAGTCDYINNL